VGLWWAGPAYEPSDGPAPIPLYTPFDRVAVDPTRDGQSSQSYLLGVWADEVPLVQGAWLLDKLYAIRGPLTHALPIIQKSPYLVTLPATIPEGQQNSTLLLYGQPIAQLHVADPGPRLLRDGYNATRVTAYVFDAQGVLLFSNAPPEGTARFDQGTGVTALPDGLWYLGANATRPEGAQRLPPAAMVIVDRLRPLLDGLPVGGVATAQTNVLVNLYGTLFVTVRIDELVYAP
jgi:hypothetical protein